MTYNTPFDPYKLLTPPPGGVVDFSQHLPQDQPDNKPKQEDDQPITLTYEEKQRAAHPISSELEFIKKLHNGDRVYKCPMCQDIVTVHSNTFYGQCPTCHMTLIDYKPAPHQEAFHRSNSLYRLNIGGFGSGKTTMCCAEIAIHALTTPNGRSLITAPILKQVKDAVLPELDKFLPPYLLKKHTRTPSPYYQLLNGHEIVVYASNDEQNIRSLNLTAFYIEEASNVDYSVFEQLQVRLRNMAGLTIHPTTQKVLEDRRMGLISTNPDEGWVRDNFLLNSHLIHTSDSMDKSVYEKLKVQRPLADYEAFLSSSRDNIYLPPGFINSVTAGKSRAWIRKNIDCYLDVKEGAVYPDFFTCVVEPFPIPKTWKRVYGFDKGYRDETALLCGAIDPETSIIYIYDEYYVAEQPISFHAVQIPPYITPFQRLYPIQSDPSIRSRNEQNGESYQTYFYRVSGGIWLEPANNAIDLGIEKVRDYMYVGKLRIFSSCENLKKEASKYTYSPIDSRNADKPIDKYNHLMDCLRYLVSILPANPKDFNAIAIPNITQKVFKDVMEDDIIEQGNVIGGISLWKK